MIHIDSQDSHLIEVLREITWENDGNPGLGITIKSGYRLRELVDLMDSYIPIMERLQREQALHDQYPALKNAHDQYQTILAMCESSQD